MKMFLEVRETLFHYNHLYLHSHQHLCNNLYFHLYLHFHLYLYSHLHLHSYLHLHSHLHHLDGTQHGLLADANILIREGYQMQGNQTTDTVQLDVITGHTLISLRTVEHTKHAMIVEHARDMATPTKVQLLKCYNNLGKRPHQPFHLPHNLLAHHYHPHQFHHPNTLTHFLILLFLQRIITSWNRFMQSGLLYNLRVVMDVNGSGLTLMSREQRQEITSVKTVGNPQNYSTRTTIYIQDQVVLISPHSLRWKKCLSPLYMH